MHRPGLPRRASLLLPLLVAAGLLGARGVMAAAPPSVAPVSVTVEGVTGEIHDNVIASLSIARAGKVGEAEARQLHARAKNEIELSLQPFGLYRPVVWSEFDFASGHWSARYRIDPGPPLRVDSLSVHVTGPGSEDTLFREVLIHPPLQKGDTLVHARYEALRERLTAAAVKGGYVDAHFERHEMRIDLVRYLAAVVVEMETGPRYVFGPVTFEQDAVDPDLVEGYVTFHEGEPADYTRLLALQQALGSSPYWSRVDVRPRRDLATGNEVPVVVTLTPTRPQKYSMGVGYGTDNGAHARANVELRRLNRRGHRSELDGSISGTDQSASLAYHLPWPYPRTDLLTFTTSWSQTQLVDQDEKTAAVGAQLSRLWAGWQESFALQYLRQNWTVGIDEGRSGFLVPQASWNRLRVNDPIDPSAGWRLRFRASAADRSALSAASLVSFEALGKKIIAFSKPHRLLVRGQAGWMWTDAFHDLPPSMRFFAGGSSSVRGYGYNRLGPRDAGGFVSGGSALLVASVEYEYRFVPAFGLATFYDVGNAMERLGDPLVSGVGGGVRWVSPIGMIRVDVGVPLASGYTTQVHVSIGPPL